MRTTAGDKVRDIILEEFDTRMDMAVVTYIIDKGWENLQRITEEQILKVEGNSFMTTDFVRSLVRCAVRICNETNQIEDFLPFIVNHLHVPKAATKEIEIEKREVNPRLWEELTRRFLYCEYEEDENDDVDTIVFNANVIETVKYD